MIKIKEMIRKTPKGILLIVIINFISAIYLLKEGIYGFLMSIGVVEYVGKGDYFPEIEIIFSLGIILFSIGLIFLGIELLRKNENSRKIEITISIFLLITTSQAILRNSNNITYLEITLLILSILVGSYLLFSKKAREFFKKNK